MSTEESILKRLETLEKQNRWMKRIGAAVIMIAASLLVMGQKAAVNRTVEANEFILRDSNGTVRSKWSMTEFGSRLSLLDSDGKERIGLVCNGLGGQIYLADPNNNPQNLSSIGILGPFGSAGPSIIMTHAGDTIELSTFDTASANAAENPFIELQDKAGFKTRIGSTDLLTERIGATHRTSAASVILFGKDKKILWKAP